VRKQSDLAARSPRVRPRRFDPIALHPWLVDRWHAEGGGALEINPIGRFTTSNDLGQITFTGFVRVSKSEALDSLGDPVPILLRFELGRGAQIVRGVFQAGKVGSRSLHLDLPGNEGGEILRHALRPIEPTAKFVGTLL
jgi:hypothetical protein